MKHIIKASDLNVLPTHSLYPVDDPTKSNYPDIVTCDANIFLKIKGQDRLIGYIQAQVLNKAHMGPLWPKGHTSMKEECLAHDRDHITGYLQKVENYLSNEDFPYEKQVIIDDAHKILYIASIAIDVSFRNHGLGLVAMNRLIDQLIPSDKDGIVLLQAGPIMASSRQSQCATVESDDSQEKLVEHWKRLGFWEWSGSDESWLCLSTVDDCRPMIEQIVPELFAGEDAMDES